MDYKIRISPVEILKKFRNLGHTFDYINYDDVLYFLPDLVLGLQV